MPSSISTLQRSAISSVGRSSSRPYGAKSRLISSGVLKKNSLFSNRNRFGFDSSSPVWMQSSASCGSASSARR